ncbi:MAG: hypothetical protein MJY58_05015 [Bacteroidaceae bacterium]|nr:hypothetical protein [Bacteroidaceae bacterium]
MKRSLIMLVLLFTGLCANAQRWIGGTVNLGVADYEIEAKSKPEKNFQIYPTVGFVYDDQWEYGVSFGFGHRRNIDGYFYGKKLTDIFVQPFVRYCLWDNGIRFEKGDLSFFVQGNLKFDHQSSPYDEESPSGHGFKTWEQEEAIFGISFQPGFKYCYDDHIIFSATFGNLYAETSKFTTNVSYNESGEKVAKRHSTKSSRAGLAIGGLAVSIAYQF